MFASFSVGFADINIELYTKFNKVLIRAQLFKTNDVVSKCFVKFSEVNFSNMLIFLLKKM